MRDRQLDILFEPLGIRDELAPSLDASGIPCYRIGSCRKPGQIADAIEEGFIAGCKI